MSKNFTREYHGCLERLRQLDDSERLMSWEIEPIEKHLHTMDEIDTELRNAISHQAMALTEKEATIAAQSQEIERLRDIIQSAIGLIKSKAQVQYDVWDILNKGIVKQEESAE